MQQHEVPQNYFPTNYDLMRDSIRSTAGRAEKARADEGQRIRSWIGVGVSKIEKGVLPASLFIADETPDQVYYSQLTHVMFLPVPNKLVRDTRYRPDGSVADFEELQIDKSPVELDDAEFLTYGERVVNALENAVIASQTAKNQ